MPNDETLAALLWARERVAALAPPTWPEWASQVRAGRHDDLPEVAEHADAFRAGQAHADAGLLAALEAEVARLRGAMKSALGAPMIDHSQKGRGTYDVLRAALGEQP